MSRRSQHATYETFTLLYNRKTYFRTGYEDIVCTVGQCKQICAHLAREMAGYTFRVEPIGGGGIQIMEWPGKSEMTPSDDQHAYPYKSFRLLATGFPWITDDTSDDCSFPLTKYGKMHICLKAFYGAPAFTKHEVEVFRKVLLETLVIPNGWRTYKKVPGI